jgi:hypothetical protein
MHLGRRGMKHRGSPRWLRKARACMIGGFTAASAALVCGYLTEPMKTGSLKVLCNCGLAVIFGAGVLSVLAGVFWMLTRDRSDKKLAKMWYGRHRYARRALRSRPKPVKTLEGIEMLRFSWRSKWQLFRMDRRISLRMRRRNSIAPNAEDDPE